MINVTFIGQAQGDIRQKSQKLEEVTGMNTCQLLEVTTINQDQEAKCEAKRKRKRKICLL
jgi:hypothetical protein